MTEDTVTLRRGFYAVLVVEWCRMYYRLGKPLRSRSQMRTIPLLEAVDI